MVFAGSPRIARSLDRLEMVNGTTVSEVLAEAVV